MGQRRRSPRFAFSHAAFAASCIRSRSRRLLRETFDEVVGAYGSVVLDVSGVARGIVSLLERAQASSIAKFSHSISFRWLLVVAVSE